MSDHDCICFCVNLKKKIKKSALKTFRNYKRIDVQKLSDDAGNMLWSHVFDLDDIDEKVCLFNEYLLNLIDWNVPLTTIRIHDTQNPWVNDSLKKLIRKRDRLLCRRKRSRRSRIDPLRQLRLKTISKGISARTFELRQKHFSKKLDVNLPSKVLWKNIRDLGFRG